MARDLEAKAASCLACGLKKKKNTEQEEKSARLIDSHCHLCCVSASLLLPGKASITHLDSHGRTQRCHSVTGNAATSLPPRPGRRSLCKPSVCTPDSSDSNRSFKSLYSPDGTQFAPGNHANTSPAPTCTILKCCLEMERNLQGKYSSCHPLPASTAKQ